MDVSPLAQSVERQTFNLRVMGSSPISGARTLLFLTIFHFFSFRYGAVTQDQYRIAI